MFAFHHTALSVRDVDRSIDFYSTFGFRKVASWSAPDGSLSITHLKLGSAFLELFCYRTPETPESVDLDRSLQRIGINHFALQVPSIESAFEALKARGVEPYKGITQGRTGPKYLFLQDPDGVFVEIIQDDRFFPEPEESI